MTVTDVAGEGLRLVSRIAGAAVSVLVVAGFVVLAVVVFVGRLVLVSAGGRWRPLSSLGARPREQETRRNRTA
jgi:hypothetical protein